MYVPLESLNVLPTAVSDGCQVILPTPSNLHYHIEKETDEDGNITYLAYCKGRSKLIAGINHCIASRRRPGDLRYLLVQNPHLKVVE